MTTSRMHGQTLDKCSVAGPRKSNVRVEDKAQSPFPLVLPRAFDNSWRIEESDEMNEPRNTALPV